MYEESKKEKIIENIIWVVITICFIAGLVMIAESKTKIVYSVGPYWVAKDYHHVYETYSGKVVDYIEENEECKMREDEIVVIKTDEKLYKAGFIVCVIFAIPLTVKIVDIAEVLWEIIKQT